MEYTNRFNKLFIINPKVDNTEKGDLIDTILDAQEPAEGIKKIIIIIIIIIIK